MKFLRIIFIISITLTSSIKADSKKNLIDELKEGGKLIFIRHAYAPGNGDPENFDINDCSSQRNLNFQGKNQAKKIGQFFIRHNLPISKIYSSEWCRCKDTALFAFEKFETKNFLNSFYSFKFSHNKDKQINDLKKFIQNWDEYQNIVFVTHYVVISEILNYSSLSGEIVISNKDFKVIDTLEIEY